MARSESPAARKRRDSSSSSSGSGSDSDSSNSSKEAVPSKKPRMSSSPPSKRKASPPSRFRDDRRRSRSPRRDDRRDRDERRRDDRRRDSLPRRERRSPQRRSRSPRRDRSPRRERSPRRGEGGRGGGGDRDRRDRSRDRERRRSPARNERDDGFGLTRRDARRDVKQEPGSPSQPQSQLMRARDARRNEQGEGKQRWGTKDMWEEEERKKREKEEGPPKDKEKVNMGTSGLLAQDTNTFNGVVIKYNEPQDAKVPNMRWRLYQFKDGDDSLPCLYIHRQSAYLIGRDRKIADLPVDHPSCSKQHAVLQYRSVAFEKVDGSRGRRIRPYIIDLASANGTFLNGKRLDASRYVELKEKDVLKFGFSSREYVLLTENALEHEANKNSGSDTSDVSTDEEDEVEKKVKKEVEED